MSDATSAAKKVTVSEASLGEAKNRALNNLYGWGSWLLGIGLIVGVVGFGNLGGSDLIGAYVAASLGIAAASFGTMLLVGGGIADAIGWQIRATARGMR